jgi:RNA polymerase sigma-70 factor (ECF subfamily)
MMNAARSVTVALGGALAAVSEEAAFVAELQAGSEEAFAYLLAVYQNRVFNLISHIVDNEADAADVLQDVFIKVFKGIRQFHGESSLKTWMYCIAAHEASNHRRGWRRRHWREVFSVDDADAGPIVAAAQADVGSETPQQVLEQAERQELVKKALVSLTARRWYCEKSRAWPMMKSLR